MRNRKFATSLAMAGALAVTSIGGAAAQDEQVTLQYWSWFPPLPTTEKMIEAFEAENPNIDIELTTAPFDSYFTDLQTRTDPDAETVVGAEGVVVQMDVPARPLVVVIDRNVDAGGSGALLDPAHDAV